MREQYLQYNPLLEQIEHHQRQPTLQWLWCRAANESRSRRGGNRDRRCRFDDE